MFPPVLVSAIPAPGLYHHLFDFVSLWDGEGQYGFQLASLFFRDHLAFTSMVLGLTSSALGKVRLRIPLV
jgi:hypothetical protein